MLSPCSYHLDASAQHLLPLHPPPSSTPRSLHSVSTDGASRASVKKKDIGPSAPNTIHVKHTPSVFDLAASLDSVKNPWLSSPSDSSETTRKTEFSGESALISCATEDSGDHEGIVQMPNSGMNIPSINKISNDQSESFSPDLDDVFFDSMKVLSSEQNRLSQLRH